MSKIDFIHEHFKLPIFYNKEKVSIQENIIQDLELVKTLDPSSNAIYNYVFHQHNKSPEEKDIFAEKVIEQISQTYTTDLHFLKDTQNILKTYHPLEDDDPINILEIWKEIKEETGFKDKYHYLDWQVLEHLNYSDTFLQFLSVYTMASPILSLLTPIIILIIPFFIIKLKGLTLSIGEYLDIIKHIVSNHAIGKITQIFTDFHSTTMDQKIYILLSVAFYLFSIYQNIVTCIKFHQNMNKIHDYFHRINKYLEKTIVKMDDFLQNASNSLQSYHEFNLVLREKRTILGKFKDKINSIGKYSFSLKKVIEIGVILRNFYELFDSKELNSSFLYSFGFNGYYTCLEGLIVNIKCKDMNFISYTKKKGKNIFKKSYYGALLPVKPVKNDISLKENVIITGPNASGKTTALKTTLINIILSQQFGCGFFSSGKLYPYKHLHCYLNIPDTSGRDSLFQSEVRRCKEIIQKILENKEETHFCVFDELYSGTNPEEAITSSTAFMEYLIKFKNVFCMLTTHFIEVCHNLDKNSKIRNIHMDVKKEGENSWKYNYSLKPGISEVKGGLKVLYDMDYPSEIIESFQKIKTNANEK
jgi:energy-coupling factor transporter ATP-binding protein EcfA2